MDDPATETPALEIRNLAHRFKAHRALDGISFSVPTGAIHGFVGPNGAGKTTTLKIVGTLMPPQTGSVKVFGQDVVHRVKDVRRQIGYMPDHFAMYQQMKVSEYLDFFAAAYGQNLSERDATIRDVLELTDMDKRKDDLIKGLSRGLQQRVSLARVLVHDPRLLLLDEPASGLDPRARIELMDILRELSALGKTVFISSHILSELATLCDSVTIIDRGRIKYSGGMEELLTRTEGDQQEFVLTLNAASPDLPAALTALQGVSAVTPDEADPQRLIVAVDPRVITTGQLLTRAIEAGADILEFQRSRRHLDDAFLDLTDPGVRS